MFKDRCLNLKAHSKKPTQLTAMLKHLFTTEQPNLCLRCRICVIIHPNPTLILKWTYLIMDAHVWPESWESSDRVKAARQQFLLKAVSDNTSRPKLNSPQHLLPQRARLDRKPLCSVGNVEFNCSYTEPHSFPTLLTWNSACCLSFESFSISILSFAERAPTTKFCFLFLGPDHSWVCRWSIG